MRGLTDLHCHILPGIDDGARDLVCAQEMLRCSVEKGVTRFVFTPHFYPERIDLHTFLENRNRAAMQLRDTAIELGVSFRVGAEIQFTPVLASLPLEELAFTGTRYLLLELLSLYEPTDVTGLIDRICSKGYTPILAHIERFPYVERDPELLYQWVKAGALAQVNAGWVLKEPKAGKRLAQYYGWNLVHLMASDMHSMHQRPQNLADGLAKLPDDMAAQFRRNAKNIFEGKPIAAQPPIKPRRWLGRWK